VELRVKYNAVDVKLLQYECYAASKNWITFDPKYPENLML